jgi:hypothetical protein
MTQKLDVGHTLPCIPQPLLVYSPDPSTLCDASVPAYPGVKSEKGDSMTSDLALRSLEECPDGGLRAWLVVFGVRLSAWSGLWEATDIIIGFLC